MVRIHQSVRPSGLEFCGDCNGGVHDDCSTGLGCLKLVANRPNDFICKCDKRALKLRHWDPFDSPNIELGHRVSC